MAQDTPRDAPRAGSPAAPAPHGPRGTRPGEPPRLPHRSPPHGGPRVEAAQAVSGPGGEATPPDGPAPVRPEGPPSEPIHSERITSSRPPGPQGPARGVRGSGNGASRPRERGGRSPEGG